MKQAKSTNTHNPDKYYQETPLRGVRLLCLVAIVISLLCAFAFVYQPGHDAGKDLALKQMLFAMAIGFGIAGGKPRNWQPWVYFYANSQGLHFPSNCPANTKTKWLAVPWKHVSEVKKQQMSKGCTGGASRVIA